MKHNDDIVFVLEGRGRERDREKEKISNTIYIETPLNVIYAF